MFAVFISAILPSLIFQTIWYLGSFTTNYIVDVEIFGNLISSNSLTSTYQNVQKYFIPILIYHTSMFSVAAFAGYLFRKVVRFYNWDRRKKIFRFQNSWHYILNGEFYDFPRANISLKKDTVQDIEFVFVDALIETNDGSYIYDGILVDYELSGDGGLETITLAESERRKLLDDKKTEEEYSKSHYYSIDGHILLLKYSEIKNLNFTYYTLDENTDGSFTPRKVK